MISMFTCDSCCREDDDKHVFGVKYNIIKSAHHLPAL
jgi:hypothetical protein